MTFDPTKPNPAESPSLFPDQCKANWNRIFTVVDREHKFNLTAAADDGLHKQVTFLNKTGVPTILTGGNSMAYGRGDADFSTGTARNELLWLGGANNEKLLSGFRAGVLFNSSGVMSFGYNVSSVSSLGSQNYKINFTNALPTNKYITLGIAQPSSSAVATSNLCTVSLLGGANFGVAQTTSDVTIQVRGGGGIPISIAIGVFGG